MNEPTQRVIQLFAAALELPLEEQSQFLANECAGQPRTLAEVKSLLDAHDEAEAESFMRQPALQIQAHQIASELAETRSGQTIGRYQLLELIGEGGMGEVYLAQDQELDRKVAVKLIKGNFKTQELLRRFNNERQILAHLNHANIASLLDGGTTDDGVPFFVMEHVEGQPIDRYADEHQLSTTDRLKLFRTVCEAVQYAHQNLIIHRDLKPTNILVTSEGDPKLLDFGIAKLLVADDSGATDETAAVFRVMTPEYASPEQVKGEPITTATDVYSLGVVLYELLTGQRPHKFRSRQPADIAEAICIKEPDKPSAAVGRGDGEKGRQGESITGEEISFSPSPRRPVPRSQLRGDLDNIVLRALRKEPLRRYASVTEFSEDVRRHLEGRPVSARQDTFSYRTGKFVRRHKIGVAAAAGILLILLAGIVATAWEAHVARAQEAKTARRFNEVRKLAHSVLFDYHDAIADLPGSTPVRQRLVRDALEYLDSLSREASNDGSLQRELATAYLKVGDVQGKPYRANLGDTAGALASYRKAQAILEALLQTDPVNMEIRRDLSIAYENIGNIQTRLMQRNEAVESQRQSLSLREGLLTADPTKVEDRRLVADSNFYLGDALLAGHSNLFDEMPWPAALESFRKSLLIREQLYAADPMNKSDGRNLAQSYQRIGISLEFIGDANKDMESWRASLESHRQSVMIREKLVAVNPTSAQARRDLADEYIMKASVQADAGDAAGALADCRKALVMFRALAAADPTNSEARRDLGFTYYATGIVLLKMNDMTGAAENFREEIETFDAMITDDRTNTENYINVASGYKKLGETLEKAGDMAGAIETHRKLSATAEKLAAANQTNVMARRTVAIEYSALAAAYTKLASDEKTPASKRKELWREARNWYQKSLDIYQDMKSKGTLSGADANKPDELAKEIAKCDEALRRVPGQ